MWQHVKGSWRYLLQSYFNPIENCNVWEILRSTLPCLAESLKLFSGTPQSQTPFSLDHQEA